MATDINIAATILAQLGGNHFTVMTGAKNYIAHPDGLSFRIPGSGFAKDGINYIKITLNGMDLYDVTFSRVRGRTVKTLHTETGIYADMLREVFRLHTGLRTSLIQ